MALHDSDKYRLMRNLNADPRLIGSEALLSPLVAHNSSQRMLMFSNNIVQALVINGAEQPNVSSGFERAFQDYTFNTSRLPQDGTTLAVIPKYRANTGPTPIRQTPSYTVIYLGAEDNKVHCIEVPTYVRGIDGFGYETKVDYKYLAPNVGLKKDQCLCRSNAVQGSKYCLGLNVNTAFMTMAETVEDAFCISDELASRMESTAIKTVIIDVDKNDIPLNVYGSEEEYKFFPDIGENIREDGIICALRQAHDSTVVSDMSELALAIPQYSHDNITYAESSGAVVLDIDIWWNPSKKVKTPPHIFSQVEKYREGHKFYCARVVETYIKECVKAHREAAPEFISLVDRCESFNAAYTNSRLGMLKKTPPKFTRKSEPIPFLQIVVTYAYKNVVGLGYKGTDRQGSKGTLSLIKKKIDMPTDDFGNTADIVIAPEAIVNRMNLGQIWEHFLDCLIRNVVVDIQQHPEYPLHVSYGKILEFINDVNPEYANIVNETLYNDQLKSEFVNQIRKDGQIILICPPFLDTFTMEWVLRMTDKYKVKASPVEYNITDDEGNFIRRVRTRKSIYIGKKYLYVLCKVPHVRSCAVTFVNQYGIPIRSKTKRAKSGYPVGLTPIRIGEDEIRILTMVVGPETTYRILTMYANSPESTSKLVEALLTAERPTNIRMIDVTENDLTKTNQSIKVAWHMLQTCGVDSTNCTMSEDDELEFTALEEEMKK